MRDIHVTEANIFGSYLYRVMVDGKAYDTFVSSQQLTWSQQDDVAAGYREALDNYDPPMLELSNYEKRRRGHA